MTRKVQRLAWAACGVVALLVVIERIEGYTANRKLEVFLHRMRHIREGMTEVEVRTAAGVPDEFLSDLGTPTDRFSVGGSCREMKGTSAMLYTFEYMGWIGERLRAVSSIMTEVVCLDERQVVVKTYSQITQF
jgi:hypothetical protein